ncbi:MAG: hypothetical protein MH472_08200 [Bacteroidia bacterium]|nr:hypothetical protein [Bacteroidia bacterium]
MNKQLLSIISLIFSLILALSIYLYFDQIEDKNLRPITIVPDNYAFTIESNASREHLKNMSSLDFMERLSGNERINTFMNSLYYYDSLIKSNETIFDWFSKGEGVYAFYPQSDHELGFFMSGQTFREVNEEEAVQFIFTHFPGRFKFSKRKFMNEKLYDFTDFKNQKHFTLAFKSKLMLFSPSGNLVENALLKINRVNNEIVPEDKLAFVKNSGNGLNLHLNYPQLAKLFKVTMAAETPIRLSILQEFAQRATYNILLDDEEIVLKGASLTHESNFEFLDLLHAQAPIENNLRKLLPNKMHFSYTFGYNGYESFAKNVKEYLLQKNLLPAYQSYTDSIESTLNFSYLSKLKQNLGNHAALLAIDEPGMDKDSCFIIAIEATDEKSMKHFLEDLHHKQRKLDSLKWVKDTLDIEINYTPLGESFKLLYTDLFENISVNQYISNGKYFFFSNNSKVLQTLKARWAKDQLWQKNPSYKDFEKLISPNSNLEIFIQPQSASKFALNYLNNDWFSHINQNMGLFKKINQSAIQFAGSNDKIFATQIAIQLDTKKAEKTEIEWSIQLDSALISEPQVMMNYSMGAQVILVQDGTKNLHAIDRDGKWLWKKPLDGKIISKISELDLYGNGKRQWMFNTAHQIYVIHDNGENCQGWPAWIPTGTQYEVNLIDPNLDKNYQLFAAGQYYKITAFNGQGRPLSYWNPKEIWPNIKSKIDYFYFNGNQVYWYWDEKGSLQFMSREAKKIAEIVVDSQYKFHQAYITSLDTNKFYILGLDSNQLVKLTYESNKKPLVQTQAAQGFNELNFSRNKTYKLEYLLSNQAQLVLQNEKGEVLYKKIFSSNNIEEKSIKIIGDDRKLIYYDKVNMLLHVENLNGKNYEPFPIKTIGKFAIGDLFGDNDFWLINTDLEHKLNLYRIK